MGKYGTNLEGFGAFEGGVNADKGAPLVSTSSDGEMALLFGPAALREIQAGVANGDFAIPPDAAGDTITEENPLPYWTFTDVNSAGAITAAIVADASAGSGNVLRFTVASGTTTGKSATLTRYVPVASSASRSFSFYAEATFDNGTLSTQSNAKITCQFYKADGVTTTGTAFSSATTLFSDLITAEGLLAPDFYTDPTLLTDTVAPSDAAYLKLTITIATVATQSAERTLDLTEVRLGNGLPEILFTDRNIPTNAPGSIICGNGEIILSAPNDVAFLKLGESTSLFAATEMFLDSPSVEITGYSNLSGSTISQFENIGAANNTTITTAGTFLALTSLEVSFTPQFVGQRWMFLFTGYASLNTAVAQYAFVRCDVTTSANAAIVSPWAYSRSENPGTSGRGGAVAISKVWVADRTTGCKFKLYGTTQTTNGLILSVSYSAMTAYPIG